LVTAAALGSLTAAAGIQVWEPLDSGSNTSTSDSVTETASLASSSPLLVK
jgi:hypothetical protein